MGCNCKTKQNTDKLIKTIEELDNSKSKDYVAGNKTALKSFFSMLSLSVYLFYFLAYIVLIIPIFIYMVVGRKSIKIKAIKFIKDEKQQII